MKCTIQSRVCVVLAVGLAIALSLTVAGPAGAHERHGPSPQAPARTDSTHVPQPDSAAMDTATTRPSAKGAVPFVLPPIRDALLGHLHNKVVHFPIVLAVVSLAGLFFGRRNPGLLLFARVLAWASALTAGTALITGLLQAGVFEGEPKAWLVLVHRNLGIATTITLTTTALLAQWARTRRQAWIAGLVAVLLVGATGYLGGLLSHG